MLIIYGIIIVEREMNEMSLDKGIASGKEHRRRYTGAKSVDKTCRNHGSCPWCKGNRLYKNKKRLSKSIDKLEELGYNSNRKKER